MKIHCPKLTVCARRLRIHAALALVFAFVSAARADYQSAVLAAHPVGFWPLDETSGTTAFDLSGHGYDGVYQYGVVLGQSGVPNPPFKGFAAGGKAAGFSGALTTSSCVTLANLPVNANTVTIVEWIYPTNPSRLGTSFWNAGQNAGFGCAHDTALGYNWHGGSGWQWDYAAMVPPVNQWSFVALVVSPTNAVFYMGDSTGLLSTMTRVDGQDPVDFTAGTSIGGPNILDNDSGFNGSLAGVAIFDYSLTPDQMAQLYSVGFGGIAAPAAPDGLSAAAGKARVNLSWNAPAGATGYNLKRSTSSGGETIIATLADTSYTDTGLVNGTTYYYVVSATNSGGASPNSIEVSATPSATITSYAAKVLSLNPVGFWPLNETSGTTALDASGHGYDGVYQSGVVLGTAGVPNPPFAGFVADSKAARFSGSLTTSSCVTLANLPINGNTVTFVEWIYPTNPARLGTTIWNAGKNAGFGCADNTRLGYNWPGGSGWQWTYGAFTPPANQWSFVAMVISPTNAVFYMGNNGSIASMVRNDGHDPVDFTTGTAIGGPNIPSNDSGFNGSLSDVAIFDYSLTPAQIAQLFQDGSGYDLPPYIVAQPVSRSAYPGGAASFSVTATSDAPLSYQWWQGTTPLAGQTNSVLSLNNVQAADEGNYSVVVASSFGSVTSSIVTLTLQVRQVGYQNLVLADQPVGYWPLDLVADSGSSAADLSGNNNPGTYRGISSANLVAGPSAYLPNAASFNGSGAFVSLPNVSVLNIGGPITMEAWVRPAAAQLCETAAVLGRGWNGNDWNETFILVYGGKYRTGHEWGHYIDGAAATPSWTHVVYTTDGTTCSQYINGLLVASGPDAGVSQAVAPWAIGNATDGGNGRYFTGNICQVALYNKALSADQVLAHCVMGATGSSAAAPVLLQQPANQRVPTNTVATFSASATGQPLPTYQWYVVSGGVTNIIPGATDATYTTAPVRDSDTGTGYFVVAANPLGSATSATALLTAGRMVTQSGVIERQVFKGPFVDGPTAFTSLHPGASLAPTKVEYWPGFTYDGAHNLPDNGAARFFGWFTPPTNGNYVFFVACDDASALWLSTDSSPANAYEIAQNQAWMWNGAGTDWLCANTESSEYTTIYGPTGVAEFRSDIFELNGGAVGAFAWMSGSWAAWPGLNPDGSIPLVAGRSYYIELDHYQGSGGQSVGVTYKLVGDPDPAPGTATLMTGSVLSTAIPDSSLPTPKPVITNIKMSGADRVVSGGNGLVNAEYNLMMSTDLVNWTTVGTKRFDASGSFSFTNTVTEDSPRAFYRLQVP